MQCTNNLRQLALALHNYHATHRTFPAGTATSIPGHCRNGTSDCRGNSVYVALLPYIEQTAVQSLPQYGQVDRVREPPRLLRRAGW